MQTLFKSATKFVLLSGLALLVFNCNKDDSNPLIDNQQVSSIEVKTILETDDLSSAADNVITELFQNGQSAKSSRLEDCYVSEFSDTGFTVSFDNCSVEGSENISGSLSVTYTVGAESTSFTATYTDLSVGDYTINGTRSFTVDASSSSENVSFTIVSDMTIELKDGSTIEEMGSKTFGVIIDSENFQNSAVTIDGDWTVKADGNTYTVNISTPLEITFGCDYFGKGIMQLNKNGLKVDVDLGDGTCDDTATVTYPDGTKEEISLKD